MYEIIFTKKAKNQFFKLEKDAQERIGAALEKTRTRPHAYFKRLIGDKAYKLRVGKHRVIAEIIKGNLTITVIEIGHRKNIYK